MASCFVRLPWSPYQSICAGQHAILTAGRRWQAGVPGGSTVRTVSTRCGLDSGGKDVGHVDMWQRHEVVDVSAHRRIAVHGSLVPGPWALGLWTPRPEALFRRSARQVRRPSSNYNGTLYQPKPKYWYLWTSPADAPPHSSPPIMCRLGWSFSDTLIIQFLPQGYSRCLTWYRTLPFCVR